MKIKLLIMAMVVITLFSCNKADQKIDYANILENCFSNTEIEILNKACTLFESQLIKNYPKESIEIKYKRFLKDISSSHKPPALMKNIPNTFLTKLRNSTVFEEIWIKYSETYYEDDSFETQAKTNSENTENKTKYASKDFYIINPKGKYVECLIKNQKNKYINEYLLAIKNVGTINSNILAQGLLDSMKDNDYNNKTVRLVIAMNLFYELELNSTE
ncbi:hypothetical protein [Lutibacter sp.]